MFRAPSICLNLAPPRRPSNVSMVHQDFRFGVMVAFAKDIDIRAVRAFAWLPALSFLTARFVCVEIGVPEMPGHTRDVDERPDPRRRG